jgi:hypothetical protein
MPSWSVVARANRSWTEHSASAHGALPRTSAFTNSNEMVKSGPRIPLSVERWFPAVAVCLVVVLPGCTIAPNANPHARQPLIGEGPDPSWTFVEFPASDFEDFRESTSSLQHWAGWIEGMYDPETSPCLSPVRPDTLLDHSLGYLIEHIVNTCLYDSSSISSLAERATHGGEWHLLEEWRDRAEHAHEESLIALSNLRLTTIADAEIAAVLMGRAIMNERTLKNAREMHDHLAEMSDAHNVEIHFDAYESIYSTATSLVLMSRLFPLERSTCASLRDDVFDHTRLVLAVVLSDFSLDPNANTSGVYGASGAQENLERAEALEWWPYALDALSRVIFTLTQLRAASAAEPLPSYDEAIGLWWEAANTSPRSISRDYHLEIVWPEEPASGHRIAEDNALWAMAAGSLNEGWHFDHARCGAGR